MGWFTDMVFEAQYRREARKIQREQEEWQRRHDEEVRRKEERWARERERREREAERAREQAEREKAMRLSTLKSDIEAAARELSNYKRSTVNPQLTNSALINQSAMRVSESSMNDDVQNSIRSRIARDESNETSSLQNEIDIIDGILGKISQIERENVA